MDADDASLSSSSMLASFHLLSRSQRHLSCRSSSPSIAEKGGKLAFGASLWMDRKHQTSLVKHQHVKTRHKKEEKLGIKKAGGRFFDLRHSFYFLFFLCFFMQAGDVMGEKIEH